MNGEWTRRRRRHGSGGQSLVVAVMVLFLLLFLGGIFIALIANNIRATQRAGNVNSASYYAEAGVRYLDEQLMTSPEGADWRPIPEDPPGDTNGDGSPIDISQNDPDYAWLKEYDPTTGEGGYTRVNFGGPVPGRGTSGGRALVRLTYSPLRREVINGSPALVLHPMGKYIRLESIGRVGRVERNDPTTWGNTQALGLRQEMVAYKSIGLTDYLRFITNKDNKAGAVSLGSPFPAYDRALNPAGDAARAAPAPFGPSVDPRDIDVDGDNDFDITVREIESVFLGPIRVNAPLTFHGYSLFTLDSQRNDTIEVAGPILMNNVDPAAQTLDQFAPAATNPNPGRVLVRDIRSQSSNYVPIFPSLSPAFTTLNGMVRDAPSGGDPNRIAIDDRLFGGQEGEIGNRNLRAVSRLAPPVIDAEIGERGLTRYRALTRNAPPLSPVFTQANPVPPAAANAAGFFGWGTGLYINNIRDRQAESELAGAQSLRSEWLNPVVSEQTGGGLRTSWKSEFLYEPPAVTITLKPRYMVITQEPGQRSYLRDNNGQRITQARIVRYTDATLNPNTPVAGFPAGTRMFEGYPAVRGQDGIYRGEYVVYAEGNIRIRGVVGGVDPETQAAFLRHMTVVSGGTIYIDGNLLRDNITPAMASSSPALAAIRGKSSIALLAKDYVTVNTTQFMNLQLTGNEDVSPSGSEITLNAGEELNLGLTLGPVDQNNTPPTVAGGYADASVESDPAASPKMFVFLRQRAATGTNPRTFESLFLNPDWYAPPRPPASMLDFTYGNKGALSFYGGYTTADFGPPPGGSGNPAILPVTFEAEFLSQAFEINPALIFPNVSTAYFSNPPSPLGLENQIVLQHDPSAGGNADLEISRIGVAPLDIRIEAIMYAQEGSFFIIPGPWFNPNPNDTLENFLSPGSAQRAGESSPPPSGSDPTASRPRRVNPRFPLYKQPMDIRITFYGTITENLPAEIGDQGAWLEKWGWVPRFYGSTGLIDLTTGNDTNPAQGAAIPTIHGYPNTNPPFLFGTGEGIVYEFNNDAITPYLANGAPIRPNPYRPTEPLPLAPRLPVAPGLLYFGERPIR